jgi:outer membrane receptor protein involved in Fe transport
MSMNNSLGMKPLCWGVLVAIAGASQVSAQENRLETVVVSVDRRENAIQDVPASIYSVGADLLDKFKHVHIGEVLNTVPGVVFNRGNGQESLIGIRSPVLTGAGSCGSFQMSQDGIPLRGSGFCNVNQLFEANTEQAGSIEIVRGPGSVMFGVNALHGAINVISPSLSGDAGGNVSLDAGPHEYRRLNFGYNAGSGDQHYGIYVNTASDGGYKDDSGFDQTKINLGHTYEGDNIRVSTVLAVTNLDQETAGYLTGFEAYKVEALKKVNTDPDAFRDADTFRLHTSIEGSTDKGSWKVTPYYRDTDMTFLMHFLPGTPLEENGHESLGVQSTFAFDSGEKIDWTVGLDMESTDGYLKQTQSGGFGPFPAGKQYDFTVDAMMWSPYAVARIEMSDQDQLSFGLRYEFLEYDYDNLMIDGNTAEDGTPCPGAGCRYSRPADRSDDFDNVTAQIGWIHDLASTGQVFANLSYAFRAPQATELYRLQANQVVTDLDSEKVDSLEGGYRVSRDRMSYELSAYYMTKDNVIFQDSDRNNVSGGKTKHRGIEFNTYVSLTESLSLNMMASFARHTYESNIAPLGATIVLDGLDMDTAPELTGNVQLDWRLNMANSLNFEWVHMDSYFTDESNQHSYAGHDLVNVRYRYDAANDWYFAARVLNLFDVDYAERADYSALGGGDRYFVGEPVSLYLTVGRRF